MKYRTFIGNKEVQLTDEVKEEITQRFADAFGYEWKDRQGKEQNDGTRKKK